MKIDSITVKLRFQTSKVRKIDLPDVEQQEAILKHINKAMEKWNAHIVDIEVRASKENEK